MSVLDRFRLDGKRALITGGSRGLGRAMAQALAEAGADLVLVGREQAPLDAAARELGVLKRRVDVVRADMGTPGEAQKTCERILSDFGPIHISINNVGGRRISIPTEQLPLEDWQRIIDLNVTSTFLCCKLIGGEMVKRSSGRIINIASIAGIIASKGIHGRTYETAKAAIMAFTKALAVDWAPYNVSVNAIAPGTFLTDPNRRWFREKPELEQTFLSLVPMGRLGEAHEIGPLALYLASDASSYMTGATLVIDGGYTAW
jgi:NAD(P)-dependent dehydrogenase (short-subunit alcohol dehydrogenase family)